MQCLQLLCLDIMNFLVFAQTSLSHYDDILVYAQTSLSHYYEFFSVCSDFPISVYDLLVFAQTSCIMIFFVCAQTSLS